MQLRPFLSRGVLTTLVLAPLVLMGVLSVNVLLPALKDPESRIYSSSIGYPSMQRLIGKPIQVQTFPVALTNLEESLAAPGESVPLQQVDVRSQVSGKVEKVYVTEGQLVRRGQPLIQLQQSPFEDSVNAARNNLTTAQKNLQTLQSTVPGRLLDLKANFRSAQARLDAANTRLKAIDNLADDEYKNNIAAAKVRLRTAGEKLKQVKLLAEQGAIAKFQLYDMQDVYATRKRELITAQQGVLNTETQRFTNQDFSITRQNEFISAKQALELTQDNLDKELANARLALDNRRIELQESLRDLNRTIIYASTDGLVSQINIHIGELADSRYRDSLMTVTQNTVFKAYIDQARLNSVKIGDKATVRLVAYPGRTFEGSVIQLNPTVKTEANKTTKIGVDRQYTYSVWVAVNDLKMAPGLQGYVKFEQNIKSLVIPESSVTHLSAGEGMVMVAEEGKAIVKKVKLGRVFDNQREVLEGLKEGEQVVPSSRALNPGDRLNTKSASLPIAERN
ncbi:efflux RND transporter periplasmic adaptor subunit [Nostoc sp. NMS9]|uniref:efflux RND transporter periplasmic adaptor subunit n=1 Tax=Nostoc sp. NMS9 TaxID=2815393 RepID=UPI0025F49AF9|nr:efflux RND transporter periplasmic adaptor subunit [Nostoc sp. NMS9]MBN3940604.1 efflux RND transporter periplasmic adaptor subunit [Nostoc sp. NMS9]